MNLRTCIITCPQRTASLASTLRSYAESDFYYAAHVFSDPQKIADRRISQAENSIRALRSMLTLDWDWLLFAEDDVEFNRHVTHNLSAWQPLQSGELICGLLYHAERIDGIVPDAYAIGGSQGVLLSRALAHTLLTNWYDFSSDIMQDLRMFRTAGRIHVHQPNLVQHADLPSTWGGRPHRSPTFERDWRA